MDEISAAASESARQSPSGALAGRLAVPPKRQPAQGFPRPPYAGRGAGRYPAAARVPIAREAHTGPLRLRGGDRRSSTDLNDPAAVAVVVGCENALGEVVQVALIAVDRIDALGDAHRAEEVVEVGEVGRAVALGVVVAETIDGHLIRASSPIPVDLSADPMGGVCRKGATATSGKSANFIAFFGNPNRSAA